MSDSVWPQRWQHTRLPRPWDSPGKNTGVGCHFLLQCSPAQSPVGSDPGADSLSLGLWWSRHGRVHSQPDMGSWDKRVTPTTPRQADEGQKAARTKCSLDWNAWFCPEPLESSVFSAILGSVPQLTKGMVTCFCFFLFLRGAWWLVPHVTCKIFPNWGWNLCPLHWKHGVIATGPPGKS